jgi:hypothetical protein
MLRLPLPSAAADTRLIVSARAEGEHWGRTFGARRLETWQYQSHDELAERFGVLEFRFRLHASSGSLLYIQREAALRWWLVRLRIPQPWAPRVEAREAPAGPTGIQIEVRLMLPAIGELMSYAGIVEVEKARP